MMQTNIRNRLLAWAAVVALILLVPVAAMQFTDEVDWDETDFIVAGTLLFGSALVYELATRNMRTTKSRLTAAVLIFAVLVWLWAELAVGLFTNWGS
jgi:peptidoglycan/LPS O-acetylase OafA/YrhL